jgi:uncharacterized protein
LISCNSLIDFIKRGEPEVKIKNPELKKSLNIFLSLDENFLQIVSVIHRNIKKMKIAITGATGLIGRKIVHKLVERRNEVIVFSRSIESAIKIVPHATRCVTWNTESKDWYSELDGIDAVIHLAGENVMGKRWNENHKRKILESRVNGTKSLVEAIKSIDKKPGVFICASAIGYYGNSESPVDESSLPASDFLATVVKLWEKEAAKVESLNIRRVSIRMGIVLDKNDGALVPFINSFKYFVGGPIGSGKQWFPWVHSDDVASIFLFALDNSNVIGAVNACSPNPVRMNEFAKTLGCVVKRPGIFSVPEFVLKIVLGERAESILSGADVRSKKIEELGYKFRFRDLRNALQNILLKS